MRMTEKEMNRIADLVVEKLMKKQREYDEQFHEDFHEVLKDNLGNARQVSEEELMLSEIARLMTLLSSYEENEQYEKAAIINRKINHLKTKLANL
ncbi:hypothetical protein DRO61_00730 [Candidatus Bathyarchaeota archaeon]|jgi:excinuclease UvrABC helicase subunit UvrB|nr:MAG: hypothetical protein DRO61_00730 [Candidatus Bathyarchaeota archaeon]